MQKNKSLQLLAEEFISYKQNIGFIYENQEYFLFKYTMYAEMYSPGISVPDKDTITGFLNTLSNSPGSLYNATAVLRAFGKHLSVRGFTDSYIIPAKNSPAYVPDPPYFFTAEEIHHFFVVCDTIHLHTSYPGRELVLPAIFRLLYCCGLRCKEARTLLLENVHLDDCFLDIIQSKGPKSRRIYISEELSIYLQSYETSIRLLYPKRKYFFPSRNDTCYSSDFISINFRRIWMKAFPDFTISSRPRAYDFRHHFVWANLNRWTRDGIDVNVMLPYLMRYLGHQHIKSTLYYFHFVPDFFPVFADLSKPLQTILPEVPYEER